MLAIKFKGRMDGGRPLFLYSFFCVRVKVEMLVSLSEICCGNTLPPTLLNWKLFLYKNGLEIPEPIPHRYFSLLCHPTWNHVFFLELAHEIILYLSTFQLFPILATLFLEPGLL